MCVHECAYICLHMYACMHEYVNGECIHDELHQQQQ